MLLQVTALFHFHCYITQIKRDPPEAERNGKLHNQAQEQEV